jgi:hypothetical protein
MLSVRGLEVLATGASAPSLTDDWETEESIAGYVEMEPWRGSREAPCPIRSEMEMAGIWFAMVTSRLEV